MSLKPCPQCGKMISDKAERCPKCGLDVRSLYSAENSQATQNINNPPINEKTAINNTSTQPPNNENPSHQGDPSFIKEPPYNEVSYIEKPKKSRSGLWISVCIILAVGIGAAIWIPVHLHNEKLKAEHLALLEQQRLDSIAAVREDSIKRAEIERIEKARQDSIKEEDELRLLPKYLCGNTFKNLEKIGFKKVYEEKHDVPDEPGLTEGEIIYERILNGRKIVYRFSFDTSSYSDFTFYDKEDLNKFISALKSIGYKKGEYNYYVRYKNGEEDWNYPPISIDGNVIGVSVDY